jgi:hypothetical protein
MALFAQSPSGQGVGFFFDSTHDADRARAMIQPVSDPEELKDIDAVRFRADDAARPLDGPSEMPALVGRIKARSQSSPDPTAALSHCLRR